MVISHRVTRCTTGEGGDMTQSENKALVARYFEEVLTRGDVAAIRIGDDVQIGPNVQFLTPTRPVEAEARRAKWEAAKPTSRGRPGDPAQQLAPPCRPARHGQARLAA